MEWISFWYHKHSKSDEHETKIKNYKSNQDTSAYVHCRPLRANENTPLSGPPAK